MSEGTWVKAQHKDIREDDVVRVTEKNGPQTTITEGRITRYEENGEGPGKSMWTIENYENYFGDEFVPDADGDRATLERFVPPFEWPTKLGAVVTGKDEDGEYTAVLVYVPVNSAENNLWWTAEWGATEAGDISGLEDLTVISEGVTVKA